MVSNFSCVVPTGVEESKSSLQPWLLITNGENCHIQNIMFDNKPPSHCYYDVGSEIPGLLGRNIGCSCREWVLMTGNCHVLVNLLSKETIELPLVDFEYNFCILTSTPPDPNCHILYFSEEKSAFIYCHPGDKEFSIKKWDRGYFEAKLCAVVAGKLFVDLYQNYSFRRMLILEFKESAYHFKLVNMDISVIEFGTVADSIYFEYSGELFTVYKIMCGRYSSNVAGFMILKADFINKKWVKVKKLGRLAIFIGYKSAHMWCASVESGITANSIYFLERDDLDSYYIYNLEEGTIRMNPRFSSMETTKHTELDWIMMPCDPPVPKILKVHQESMDSEKENKEDCICLEKRKREKGVQNSWNTVQPELLNLIQLHLFGRDHAVFRGVCPEWQQVPIRDYTIPSIPPLLSLTTLLEQCQSFSPLLMFQEDITISYDSVPIFRFFDPVHRKLYRTGIPELRATHIHYSRDGWLLVSRCDESIFFFNPLTQEKIELPRMPSDLDLSECSYTLSFSSPPTCSNCLVVGIEHFGTVMYTLKHIDETWREQKINELGLDWTEDRKEYLCNPVVLNGLHYFMCENRDMVVFNLKDGAESQFPDCQSCVSKFKRPACLRGEDFLVEIDGGAAFVSVKPNGGEISIYKWDDWETDWQLMEGGVDFGGKEMFLSERGSFMEKIDDVGGMGNTIFLPMIDDAKDGVFYSLATHRYHTFYSGYSSKLPYNVDKFLDGIWVKPDREIVGDNNLKWFM